jgi:hypothetical protein
MGRLAAPPNRQSKARTRRGATCSAGASQGTPSTRSAQRSSTAGEQHLVGSLRPRSSQRVSACFRCASEPSSGLVQSSNSCRLRLRSSARAWFLRDHDHAAVEASRTSRLAKAKPSPAARSSLSVHPCSPWKRSTKILAMACELAITLAVFGTMPTSQVMLGTLGGRFEVLI